MAFFIQKFIIYIYIYIYRERERERERERDFGFFEVTKKAKTNTDSNVVRGHCSNPKYVQKD